MNSLKTEFREHFFFYQKHIGWLPAIILLAMMPQLVMPETFSTLSEYAVYSTNPNDATLIAGAFVILTVITNFSILFISFLYACTIRFGISPSSKIKQFIDVCRIYSNLKKKFTSDEISNAASKLPKYSENFVNDILKHSKEKNKEISRLRKENKKLKDKLFDNDK